MKTGVEITKPALESVYLTPAEIRDVHAQPIRDDEARVLRDESGLPVYQEGR